MKPILITGGSGFLGANLAAFLIPRWPVYITAHRSPAYQHPSLNVIPLDILHAGQVLKAVKRIQPAILIHTAAMSSLNDCEENPEQAWEVNVKGTENLALAALVTDSRFIYFSTDIVFNGAKSSYSEDDPPAPINIYGQTKLEGERIVSVVLKDYVILRIALLYGWSLTASTCFCEHIINALHQGQKVTAFTDEYRTPLYVQNLCRIMEELIPPQTAQGLFHVAGLQRMSRYEQVLLLAGIFGFPSRLVVPGSVKDIRPLSAARPKDCSLGTDKLRSVIRTKLLTLEEGYRRMFQAWRPYGKPTALKGIFTCQLH